MKGQKRLEGELKIQGSKNSCLPMLAASLLAKDKITINNCPDILDVREMIGILKYLGCDCEFENNTLVINSTKAVEKTLPPECSKLRASIVFMGAMLGRFGRVVMPYPGGCNIGKRPIDFHMAGFVKLGAQIAEDEDTIIGIFENECTPGKYAFPTPSLGALENLLLGAVCADGTTVFENCTKEPEIVDFCDFLNKMGAKIRGAGTSVVIVTGVGRLHGCTYTVPGDRIVAGTYLSALAITGGNIKLTGINPDRIDKLIFYLRKMGGHIFTDFKSNEIIGTVDLRCKGYPLITTGPYPELATDLQPQLMAASCFLSGITRIRDNVYPGRYGIVEELKKMGADIYTDEKTVMVRGLEELNEADVYAKDLRGGAALVIAALGCRGISGIYNCSYICRGYEDIQRDLQQLGADIEWINDEEEAKAKEEL